MSLQGEGEEEEENLIAVDSVIPAKFRSVFRFSHFNQMQSIVVEQLLKSNENIVVAAPTGGGKTVIHELAILHFLITAPKKNLKCVFLAPNKALCQQRLDEWSKSFGSLGYSVLEVTGDSNIRQSLQCIAKASIIITTPEKWDSLTRNWRQHIFLLGSVDLLLIDEIHHLGDSRGSTLEALVVRMGILSNIYMEKCVELQSKLPIEGRAVNSTQLRTLRIIALSATLPNLADIGNWLKCKPQFIHFFDESFRPVPLRTYTLSFGNCRNTYLFERSLDERVPEVIRNYSNGKQTLIFCSSKNSCEVLAGKLSVCLKDFPSIKRVQESRNQILGIQDSKLRGLAMSRIGYHHSGLPPDDRAIVEKLYLDGFLHVLCATSTLAYGVNLPAHLVIIKGTNMWRGSSQGFQRTNHSSVIQMLGRAGRPGFDDFGVAVIMTSNEDKIFYETLTLSADIVESTLCDCLTEAICSEVTQNVITTLEECIFWLKNTFFFVRLRKNPTHYGFNSPKSNEEMEQLVNDICSKSIQDLDREGLIKYEDSGKIEPQPEAHIMTRNIIKFETMIFLTKIPKHANIKSVLIHLCECNELHKPVRRQDKKFLNTVMKNIRYPLKEKVQSPEMKTFVLLQSAVSKINFVDFSLRVEQAEVVEKSIRLLSALQDLCLLHLSGMLLVSTLLLERALFTQLWEINYGSIFSQCTGITEAVKRELVERGLKNFTDLEGCSLKQIERLSGCGPTESQLLQNFGKICKYSKLRAFFHLETGVKPTLEIQLNYFFKERSLNWREDILTANLPTYQLVCFSTLTSELICHRKIPFDSVFPMRITVVIPENINSISQLQLHLISTIVGLDFILNHNVTSQAEQELSIKQQQPSFSPIDQIDETTDTISISTTSISKINTTKSYEPKKSPKRKNLNLQKKSPNKTLIDFGYFNFREIPQQPLSLEPNHPYNYSDVGSDVPSRKSIRVESENEHDNPISNDFFSQDNHLNFSHDQNQSHQNIDVASQSSPEKKFIIRSPNPELIMLRQKASELQLSNIKFMNRIKRRSSPTMTQDNLPTKGIKPRNLAPFLQEEGPEPIDEIPSKSCKMNTRFFDEEPDPSQFESFLLNHKQANEPKIPSNSSEIICNQSINKQELGGYNPSYFPSRVNFNKLQSEFHSPQNKESFPLSEKQKNQKLSLNNINEDFEDIFF